MGPSQGAKGAGYGWLPVIAGTLASIGGNVAHAHPDLVARAIAAAIPLAVLAMLEGLKGDAGEVTRLTGQAAAGDGPAEPCRPTSAHTPPSNAMAAPLRRTPTPGPWVPSARSPPGPHRPEQARVGARLQAAYAQPRPDGQAWTARTLAEAAGCGRSSAASFLQRQRPSTGEDAR